MVALATGGDAGSTSTSSTPPSSRTPPSRRCCCGCASPRRPARRCTPSPCACQVKIEPQRRHYGDAEVARLYELFGETAAVGRLAAAVPVDPRRRHRARLRRHHRGRPADRVHVRLRGGGGQVPPRPRRRGRCPSCCCSPAPSSPGAAPASSPSPISWQAEASYRLPVATWRAVMDRYFPGSGWVRVEPRHARPAAARSRPARALTGWDDAFDAPVQGSGGGPTVTMLLPNRPRRPVRRRPRRGRRRAVRGLRALPVPGVVAEEPDPVDSSACWPRRRWAEADGSERWANRTEVLVDPGDVTRRCASASAASRCRSAASRAPPATARSSRSTASSSAASPTSTSPRPSSTSSTCRRSRCCPSPALAPCVGSAPRRPASTIRPDRGRRTATVAGRVVRQRWPVSAEVHVTAALGRRAERPPPRHRRRSRTRSTTTSRGADARRGPAPLAGRRAHAAGRRRRRLREPARAAGLRRRRRPRAATARRRSRC